ncbi:serine/threonine-protein kinase [Microbacterium karelineae]|uniref:serine/threonine-protein kinase n=1 Tax=Microbacterium karelineae TaxID=2654283 RepID=UPI0012EAA16A|nr:serine/threonine-protein kinase [Microbacterium karelineae]
MSARRAPAAPPSLPGFSYVKPLGSGGFADVFLYEQHLPRRRVAVKVLLPDVAAASTAQFTSEANTMAMLSSHPAIVTIFEAGVSADGRPYLVMEYCPGPNLQVRYRREPFGLAEALRAGVAVVAAVETAHRAGVVHRDIKPANILVTAYNRPALTDFGIASTNVAESEAVGLSVPWSPPEALAEAPTSGVRADVYQLGATIYTLLAGRSPFEIPGESNQTTALIDRIERTPLPSLGRADVPEALFAVLARAMAKDPAHRFATALELGRALQEVEISLGFAPTMIDILDDHPAAALDDVDDELTRVRGIVTIAPDEDTRARPTGPPAQGATEIAPATIDRVPGAPADDATVIRSPRAGSSVADETVLRPRHAPPPGDDTVLRDRGAVPAGPPAPQVPPAAAGEAASPPTKRRWPLVVAASIVAIAVVGVVGSFLAQLAFPEDDPQPETSSAAPQDPLGTTIPQIVDGSGVLVADEAQFSWGNPDPQGGDYYLWREKEIDGVGESRRVDDAAVDVPRDGADRVCIEVFLARADGRVADEPVTICAPE